jgi:hypothetical protein
VGYGRNERKVNLLLFSFSGTALEFAAAHGLSPTGETQIRGHGFSGSWARTCIRAYSVRYSVLVEQGRMISNRRVRRCRRGLLT